MKYYMNIMTGSVKTYENWWYKDENGQKVNAVDKNEVVEVIWNGENWEEAK